MPTLKPSRRKLADKSLVCVFFPAWSIPSSAIRRDGKRLPERFGLLITLSDREHLPQRFRLSLRLAGPLVEDELSQNLLTLISK